MNLTGIINGGLLAGLLINVGEFALNMFVVPMPAEAAGSLAFWVVYAFLLGLLVAYMYALVRPRWGAGPKTAACAGIMVWILHNLLPTAGAVNMGMFELPVVGLVWSFAEMAVAGVLAGTLYSED